MLNNIAIIGAGNIGFRHFQGVLKNNITTKIYLVDPKVNDYKNKFLNQENVFNHEIFFYKDLKNLPKSLDFLICSTSASIRGKLVASILDNINVRYMLLEKVVFQLKNDFDDIISKINLSKTKVWVNCPQRTFRIYKRIKDKFRGKKFEVSSLGNGWNLASNTVHVLDLFCYLTGNYDIKFVESQFLNDIIKSKREGYFELKGYAKIINDNGTLTLEDSIKYNYFRKIFIKVDNQQIEIDETNNVVYSSMKQLDKKLKFPFQSDLTTDYIKDLNNKSSLDLVSLENCKKYHVPMLTAFNNKFSEIFEKKIEQCPIT